MSKSSISLGFEIPDYSKELPEVAPSGTSNSKHPTKTAYPSLTIPGNKSLARALRPGQKFTATVTFCVTEVAVRDRKDDDDDGPVDQYGGTRVELEAEAMVFDGIKVEDATEEVDGATAFRKYMGKKKPADSEGGEEDGE